MTPSSDGWDDMHDEHPLDDPLLTDLLAELRSWGTGGAPEPSPALATLLDGADSVDPVPPPARRKKMLVTKLAGLGLALKVALGAGVAAAAVTTAGATGVLPDAAQHGVASVINAISPLEIPDVPAKVDLSVNAEVGADVTIPTTTIPLPGIGGDATDDEADDTSADDEFKNHGACVSEVAKDKSLSGREHGQAVSAIAQSDCGKGDDDTPIPSTTTTTTTTTTTVASASASESSGPGNSGNRGNGNGNGNSGGN